MNNNINLIDLLKCIDPVNLNYQEWINVGMALKHEGYSVSDWEEWSRRDAERFHHGECEAKWNTFGGSGTPVTAGTIIMLAKQNGYKFHRQDKAFDWNDEIGGNELTVIDKTWVEPSSLEIPETWDPVNQLITYLETLFESSENVGYVTRSWMRGGKRLPSKGCWDRTAGRLIQQLAECNNDIGSVLGDYDEETGAWIRFNPLDGKGCKDANVTDFRYALVESDSLELERQKALMEQLELPIACLVYSGGKSLHAIVKIGAYNYNDYRDKVDYLYKVCEKNGLMIDKQNKNPSRLSRMPGVMRGGQKQYLLATNIGKQDFNEWKEWIESISDDLPDPENMAEVWENIPELSPPLIDGILRQGHKMLIAGPSKAGKSYALIEMCIAIAEGKKWLDRQCTQGKVMYVNLELDNASCFHRFKDVYSALNIRPDNLKNIDIWNLRGKSMPMDKLAPKLIRRAIKKNYIAIIIDPIYKVITGDENSADQMAKFCNQFDKVCTELKCAVIYCHHHSKGAQGGKRSMDRASGSGVFARDPDALLDLIELNITDELREQEENAAICDVCRKWLERHNKIDEVSESDLYNGNTALRACRETLKKNTYNLILEEVKKAKAERNKRTAWRIDGTLREFPKPDTINLWFDYPIHKIDDTGVLSDLSADESDASRWSRAKKKKSPAEKKKEQKESIETAYEACKIDGEVTVTAIAEYMEISERTVRNRLKNINNLYIKNGKVCEK